MKPTPETDAEELIGFGEFGKEQTLVSAKFARKLERERDEWKAAHDNQVKLRRMLMDRPDLKERAELVTQLAEKLELLERQRNKGLETITELAEERDQLRKVADELARHRRHFNKTHGLSETPDLARYYELHHIKERNTIEMRESELAALNGSPCVVCGSPLTLGIERTVPVLMVHCNTCGSEVPWHVTQKLNLYKARGKTAASVENRS